MQYWGRKVLFRAGKLCPPSEAFEKGGRASSAHPSVPESISGHDKNIYHFLSRAFRQCVAIPQIIDFDVFNIVTIRNVDFTIDIARALT